MSELEIHLLAVAILGAFLACCVLFQWFLVSLGVLVLRAITFGKYLPNLSSARDEFLAVVAGMAAILGGFLAASHIL